jgi:hypothetical protein
MNLKSGFVRVLAILAFAIAICWSSQAAEPGSTGSGRLVVQRAPGFGERELLRLSIDGKVSQYRSGKSLRSADFGRTTRFNCGHTEKSASADFNVAYGGSRTYVRVHRRSGVGPRCISAAIESYSLGIAQKPTQIWE